MRCGCSQILFLAAALFAGDALSAEPAAEAPPAAVAVTTFDGREFRGAVDERTDDNALWLRQEQAGIVLVTAAPWQELVAATVDEAPREVAALKAESAEMKSAATPATWTIVESTTSAPVWGSLGGGVWPPSAGRPPRVRHLEILDARPVNYDRDVEADGLAVTIAAIGEDGVPLSVRGSLTAELVGERRPLEERDPDFDALGQWSERVRHTDFVDGAATYYLPFRTTAPEWEFDLLPDALLTVRLGASGHGNFAASAPVILREFSPLRDNLQQAWGTRLWPDELTGRRPLNRFGPQRGLWLHWTR